MANKNLEYPWVKNGDLYCEKCKPRRSEQLDDYSIYNDGLWNFCVSCGKKMKTSFN